MLALVINRPSSVHQGAKDVLSRLTPPRQISKPVKMLEIVAGSGVLTSAP